MKKKTPSQLMELFLAVAAELGITEDRDIATLADVGPENVSNWRSGGVREFKPQKFLAAKNNLIASLRSLRAQAGMRPAGSSTLSPIEIEDGSSPADLQRQFRNRVIYDYLGHRFLYFEPQGALAWENLIKRGYEQDRWLAGVRQCAELWLETRRDNQGQARGPIARALRLARRDRPRGLDIISLGPGEGGKEAELLRELMSVHHNARQRCRWLSCALVDVSIPLLISAARSAREALADHAGLYSVLPLCADFEEGNLEFHTRLRSFRSDDEASVRLVLILGNVLGNLRDEETFVRQKLWRLVRPGDLVWVEVGLRNERIEIDPLFRMTRAEGQAETAAEANRRLLLEGPYRRLAAALGRAIPNVSMRVWLREDDDSARIPGSCNFCHDLIIEDEGRVITMLYSRRYSLDELLPWFEGIGFGVEAVQRTSDSKGRVRVAHILLRRR